MIGQSAFAGVSLLEAAEIKLLDHGMQPKTQVLAAHNVLHIRRQQIRLIRIVSKKSRPASLSLIPLRKTSPGYDTDSVRDSILSHFCLPRTYVPG